MEDTIASKCKQNEEEIQNDFCFLTELSMESYIIYVW